MATYAFTISDQSCRTASEALPHAIGDNSGIDALLPKIVGSHLADASVSTRETIDEIRTVLPSLAMNDEDLAIRIADHAISIGLAVAFDSRGG